MPNVSYEEDLFLQSLNLTLGDIAPLAGGLVTKSHINYTLCRV